MSKNENSDKRYSFIDGPITANNPMGVHHAWGRSYKDLFARFRTMQGYKQRYQNGFDGQGLWIEVEVEKELGFQSKTDIEKAVKYAQSSYELGLVDLMYLLNAQQQLHNISLQENKILSDRYKNKIDLILSLGGRLDYE